MNGNNRLISRWDTAPHHKEITTFHLHTPEGIRECDKVNLIEVVDIVKALISKRGVERLKTSNNNSNLPIFAKVERILVLAHP
jgi:hypothetical protein